MLNFLWERTRRHSTAIFPRISLAAENNVNFRKPISSSKISRELGLEYLANFTLQPSKKHLWWVSTGSSGFTNQISTTWLKIYFHDVALSVYHTNQRSGSWHFRVWIHPKGETGSIKCWKPQSYVCFQNLSFWKHSPFHAWDLLITSAPKSSLQYFLVIPRW